MREASELLYAKPDACSSEDYRVFKGMEFGLKAFPSVLFFVLGSIRYFSIRDIGVGRVNYSRHFKLKFAISATMGAAFLAYVFVVWATPASNPNSSWINQCDEDYFVVFFALESGAWFFSCFIMLFEYQRRLSEERYANQLFWCLNFLFEVVTFLVLA